MMPANLLEQKSLIENCFKEQEYCLSSFSFPSIFSWKDYFQFDLEIIQGSLCIFAQNQMGMFLYLPPLGRMTGQKVIRECFRIMDESNRHCGLSRIENVSEQHLDVFPHDEFVWYRKSYEYCYDRRDIAGLKGNAYKSKRSSYNQFRRLYHYQYLAFEESMLKGCLQLYDRWADDRRRKCANEIFCEMLKENRKVHELILRQFSALNLIGRVVLVGNQIRAYTVGFEINPKMFCVLFEIADLTLKGLPTFIFSRFCDDEALRKYVFINVMDDFEMEHVKKAKLSFHPILLFPSYVVKRKEKI